MTQIVKLGEPEWEAGDPLGALAAIEAREREFTSTEERWRYLQHLGTFRSFVGDLRGAHAAFDAMRDAIPAPEPDYAGFTAPDAVEVIRRAARGRQAVFLNEAHHVPQHRAFSIQLLRALRADGFDHFAAEALSTEPGLAARGYPIHASGYYTREPFCGELVREALRLGFTVVPYEDQTRERPSYDEWAALNHRDRTQAAQLAERVFAAHPSARLFVHAGYDHIRKAGPGEIGDDGLGRGGWVTMARFFEKLAGISPLSVDQAQMTERSGPRFELAAYRGALAQLRLERPCCLVSPDGEDWLEPLRNGAYDLQVVHPRTRYRRGRPDWALLGGARRWVEAPKDFSAACKPPCLVHAFYANESADAVPAERFIMTSSARGPAFALPPGRFRLRALAAGGAVLAAGELTV